MEKKKISVTKSYADLLEQTLSALHLSYTEIRKRYRNYPLSLSNHIENGIEDKYIEIRFDKDEATITCTFDAVDKCDFAYIFVDRNEISEELTLYLKENYDYDYIKNRWQIRGYYVEVKKNDQLARSVCFMFYSKD